MNDKSLLDKALGLIEKYKVTAYEIDRNTHLSAVGVQKIIDGKTKRPQKPSLEAIISYITNKYEKAIVNIDEEIINGVNKPNTLKNGLTYHPLNDGTFDVEVKVLPFKAYASYLDSFSKGVIYDEMETAVFNVDHQGQGNYMAFIIKGDSMNGGKLNDTPDGAKVLGRELGRQHWRDGFYECDYGWIILSKQNIFHKDIVGFDKETGEITCHSRNESPEYCDFKLSLNDVNQIFKVIKRLF
ncbi:hypothetical protein [Paenimyroides ceti]